MGVLAWWSCWFRDDYDEIMYAINEDIGGHFRALDHYLRTNCPSISCQLQNNSWSRS